MRHWDNDETICAIASGNAPAPRGIVRLSGPNAIAIAASLVEGDAADQMRCADSAIRIACQLQIDALKSPLLAACYVWPDHRSFSGQPSVEIHTIGNPLIMELIVESLLSSGARAAQPGEFTYRAFLSGRLDLTQCEAVLAVIHAKSEQALHVSLSQLAGGLSQPLSKIRGELINLLADLEAGLDFVDEDIEFVSRDEVLSRLEQTHAVIAAVQSQLVGRRESNQAPLVALIGPPNAGKSSLINALLDSDHSIVSAVAGTTRDSVRATLQTSNGTVRLVDTAGLEAVDSTDANAWLRTQAQVITRESSDAAQLLLYCSPITELDKERFENIPKGEASERWLVLTKSDLHDDSCLLNHDFENMFSRMISTSAKDVDVDGLKNAITDWLGNIESEVNVVPMTLVRCADSVSRAKGAIDVATTLARSDDLHVDELIAAELRNALHELGLVVGEIYTDDILDALFSRFCIGK
jgi:tRNA modification GTPase